MCSNKGTLDKSAPKERKPSLLPSTPSAQGQPSEAASPTLRETRPRLRSGERSGRPRTRLEALQIVPTRCPMQIYTYLKSIAPYLYPSLTQMFEDTLRRFFTERPWEHGLHWRQPKSALTVAGKNLWQTAWTQVNMRLPEERVAQRHQAVQVCGISLAGVCDTAVFWWAQYVYPPMKMIGNPASATKAKVSQIERLTQASQPNFEFADGALCSRY